MENGHGDIISLTVYIKLLKPSSFFKYYQVEHSKVLHGVHFALFCKDLRTDSDFCIIHHFSNHDETYGLIP